MKKKKLRGSTLGVEQFLSSLRRITPSRRVCEFARSRCVAIKSFGEEDEEVPQRSLVALRQSPPPSSSSSSSGLYTESEIKKEFQRI